jgi:predicted alpha/beta-fold hydrolase
LQKITTALIERYSDFQGPDDYFKGYTISSGALKHIAVPSTLIISQDDPIIPIGDFYKLKTNPLTNLIIHRFGGHNGFIEGLFSTSWYERKIVELFDKGTRS